MELRQGRFGIIRSIIYITLITVFFFTALEMTQRIRYFLRFNSTYWLFFGFVDMPKNYFQMLEMGLEKPNGKVESIEVPSVFYNGYKKYNPKYRSDEFTINSYGFRGKEFNPKKEEGVTRIVSLGGSTTFGVNAKDGYTYPEFLERELNSKGGDRYEVINAGVGSASVGEIAKLFINDIVRLRPDIVTLNSVFNNLYFSRATYAGKLDTLQRISLFLRNKSLFYMTLREKIASLSHRPMDDLYKISSDQILNNFLKDDAFWRGLEESFREIIAVAKKNDIRVILIKEPVLLSDYKESKTWMLLDNKFGPVYKKTYSLLDKVARDEHIDIVDTDYYFDNSDKRNSFFTDGVHLTPAGNEYMAKLIAAKVSDTGQAHK